MRRMFTTYLLPLVCRDSQYKSSVPGNSPPLGRFSIIGVVRESEMCPNSLICMGEKSFHAGSGLRGGGGCSRRPSRAAVKAVNGACTSGCRANSGGGYKPVGAPLGAGTSSWQGQPSSQRGRAVPSPPLQSLAPGMHPLSPPPPPPPYIRCTPFLIPCVLLVYPDLTLPSILTSGSFAAPAISAGIVLHARGAPAAAVQNLGGKWIEVSMLTLDWILAPTDVCRAWACGLAVGYWS